MVESLFNVKKELDNEILLYNSFTKYFVKVDKKYWNDLLTGIESVDENHVLVKGGFLVGNQQLQLNCYKLGYMQKCFCNKVLTLVIAPTLDCNLACRYCFEGSNKKSGEMTEHVENRIIDFIKSQKPQSLYVTWFGGEPLLAFDRILSLSKKIISLNIPLSSTMITNGTLLTKKVVENLHYLNLKRIQISMDGFRKDHDKRRCFKTGAPTFDIIINNISYLLQYTDLHIGVQVTVDHNNINACEELTKFISDKFPAEYASNRIFVSKNFVRDRTGMGEGSGCLSNDDLINNDILDLSQGSSKYIRLPDTALPCMHKTISNYAIDPEGFLYKCMEHLGVPNEAVGSLMDRELSISKLAEKMLGNDFLTSEECLKCNILPICGGGCPIDRCKVAKGLKKNSCSIYKSRFEDLLPYYYKNKFGV